MNYPTILLTAVSIFLLFAPPHVGAQSLDMNARLDNTHVLEGAGNVHALVTVQATDKTPGRQMPVNLALVIDRSGSMSGQKIRDARAAAIEMVDRLRRGDRVAIVSYDDTVRVDVPSTTVDRRSRLRLKDRIRRITQGGSTNLSGGLVAGHRQVRKHLNSDGVNRVILISDGLANKGITSVPALNRIAREAQQAGIVTTTLGLGSDYNEDLMTAVANHGGGNYYFVERSTDIASVLSGELGQMMATVGRQATLELTPPPGVKVEEVYGYAWNTEGPSVVVRLGDIFSKQSRAILLRLRVPARVGRAKLGELKMHYEDTLARPQRRRKAVSLGVVITSDRGAVEANRNPEVEARVAEIELATSMTRAATLVQEGKYKEAKVLLQGARDKAAKQATSLGGVAGASLRGSAGEADELLDSMSEAPASPKARRAMVKRSKAKAYKLRKK